jgi:Fe2+ or Zn2+ uptake regulation protein
MKLDLLTNASVVDDAIRFVSEKAACSGANAEPKTDTLVVTECEKQQEQEDIMIELQQQQKSDNNTTTTTNQVF